MQPEKLKKSNFHQSLGEAFWRKHVEKWQASQLSQSAYCRQEKFAISTFASWVKKIQSSEPQIPGDFIQVQTHCVETDRSSQVGDSITIKLSQFEIQYTHATNHQLLQRFLEFTGGLSHDQAE